MTVDTGIHRIMGAFKEGGSLDRLSKRILAGKVVFFVGSGFSLDSEHNSSWRLVGRLMARFAAMTQILMNSKDANRRSRAEELQEGMKLTFSLPWPESGTTDPLSAASISALKESIGTLCKTYYDINDWMCSAFNELLVLTRQESDGVCDRIVQRETDLREKLAIPGAPGKIDSKLLNGDLERLSGKAFFLDTMGFADKDFMAGNPFKPDLETIAKSYEGRLMKRHVILARLAREGLCPTLLTTNYDLLLEGACRLIGFSSKNHPAGMAESSIPVAFREIARIAEAEEFFAGGDGYRSALVVKIHGCVKRYQEARQDLETWRAYLPAMVFTYREIQNWRRDSWSRDLVRTLLRTRTIVFCGYSGADPVLHDTFRSVYEEMADQRERSSHLPETFPLSVDPGKAPAFFLGTEDRKEFHGTEILRSASHASGTNAEDVTSHPNYIQFFKEARFPSSDELLLWLYHRVFRSMQRQALEADLPRIARLLLGGPVAPETIDIVKEHFRRLEQSEMKTVSAITADHRGRARLQRICAWTDRFQTSLLRELALGEAMFSRQGPGVDLCRLRESPWYYPASERPDWTAWAAVIEVALRRKIAAQQERLGRWEADSPHVSVANMSYPAIFFRHSKAGLIPDLLGILVVGFSQPSPPQVRNVVVRRSFFWRLSPDSMPWPTTSGRAPGAKVLWAWATKRGLPGSEDWKEPFEEVAS